MPFDHWIDHDRNWVFARFTGTVNLEEVLRLIDVCRGEPVAGLIDFTGCTGISLGVDDLWECAKYEHEAEERWGEGRMAKRVAILTPQLLLYGLLRIYQAFRRDFFGRQIKPELRAFQSRDKALEWLEAGED